MGEREPEASDLLKALKARNDRRAQEMVDAGEAETLDVARSIIGETNRRQNVEAASGLGSQIASAAAASLDGLQAKLSSTFDGLQGMFDVGRPPDYSKFGQGSANLLSEQGQEQLDEVYEEIAKDREEQRQQRDEWRTGVRDTLGLLVASQQAMVSEQAEQGTKTRKLRRSLWVWGLILGALISLMTSFAVLTAQELELVERFLSLFQEAGDSG